MKKEADVLKEILDYLKKLGLACYRSPNMPVLRGGVGNMYLSKAAVQGLPDITGVIYGGRAIYIEVKAPKIPKLPFEMDEEELQKYYERKAKCKDKDKERREEQQSKFLSQMKKAGALCLVARSVDDVKRALLEAGYFSDVDAPVH